MNRLLLISYNFSPELTGIGKYNGEMIDWLVKSGYECSVLTAYPYYPHWKIQAPYDKKRFMFSKEKAPASAAGSLTIYRCPIFVPANPTAIKRVLMDLSFFATALMRMLTFLFARKFDFIVCVAPSFQVGLLGVLYKKIRGAKLLYHVQDLQIEAARDLNLIRSEAFVNTLFKAEKKILSNSDMVSTISDEMASKIHSKSGKRTFLFPNWTNTKQFFPIANRDALKTEFGFQSTDKIVLYSGAVGEKQGLESILHAAKMTESKTHIKFIICGSGPYAFRLREMANRLLLSNVHFMPLQPIEKFNRFLNIADLHLIIQKQRASDLVMPSKLATILSVGGVALITANEGTALHTIVKRNDMGFLVNAEDQVSLNHAIQEILSGDYSHLGLNARNYAMDHLSVDRIMTRFERALKNLRNQEVAVTQNPAQQSEISLSSSEN